MSRTNGDALSVPNGWPRNNQEFLTRIFGAEAYRAYVCAYPGDPKKPPPGAWDGGQADKMLVHCQAGTNNYYAVSLFTAPVRQGEFFDALYVLGFDDVGQAQPADKVRAVMGREPTYRLETSPGSEHWGFVLETPIRDPGLADALIHALRVAVTGVNGKDPGQEGITRYLRLPFGINGKASLGADRNYPTRVIAWDDLEAMSDAEIAALIKTYGVTPDKRHGRPGKKVITPGTGSPDDEDTVLSALRALDRVLAGPRDTPMGHGYDVICPWVDEHTDRAATGAVYVPGDAFKCQHGHCYGRGYPEMWDKVDALLREDSGGLVGLVHFDKQLDTPIALLDGTDFLLPAATARVFRRCDIRLRSTDYPPQPWLAENVLSRKAVTMLIGPPDVGKSFWLTRCAITAALGQDWGAVKFAGVVRKVLTVFTEEPEAVQARRREAALLACGADVSKLDGQLLPLATEGTAELFKGRDLTPTQAWRELIAEVERFGPDILVLDPLAELHDLPENDNTFMRGVTGKLRALALRYDLAVLMAHHTPKNLRDEDTVPGSLAMARGAGSIGAATRIAFTLTRVGAKDKFGVDADRWPHFVRLEAARNALGPYLETQWYEKVPYALKDGTATITHEPRSPPAGTLPDPATLDLLIQDLASGVVTKLGVEPWLDTFNTNYPRSLVRLFQRHGIFDDASQKRTLETLKAQHGVVVISYTNTKGRKNCQGLRTTDGFPDVAWDD
jgi:hypothetical protein